jgi:RimJ/RimL family protein N-acetyltransferase
MRMLIIPYASHHLHQLALQPHQQHLGTALREHGWAEQVSEAGPCWTAIVDGQPIACAGFQDCWEGRAIAWAILGETAGRHMAALTRAVRRALAAHPAERIEAQALVGFAPALRWARLLGFAPEGVLRKFHQGRDYQAFVLLKNRV